jgi:purine-binding chemotaxis protein CheW
VQAVLKKEPQKSTLQQTKQYLCFSRHGRDFGVSLSDILAIQTLQLNQRNSDVDAVDLGIVKYRNQSIPILGLESIQPKQFNEDNRFIITVLFKNKDQYVGLAVDEVTDILDISEDSVIRTDEFKGLQNAEVIDGLIKNKEQTIIIVNVSKIADLDLIQHFQIFNSDSLSEATKC